MRDEPEKVPKFLAQFLTLGHIDFPEYGDRIIATKTFCNANAGLFPHRPLLLNESSQECIRSGVWVISSTENVEFSFLHQSIVLNIF